MTLKWKLLTAGCVGMLLPLLVLAVHRGYHSVGISWASQLAAAQPFSGVTILEEHFLNAKPAQPVDTLRPVGTVERAIAADGSSYVKRQNLGSEESEVTIERASDGAHFKLYDHLRAKVGMRFPRNAGNLRALMRNPETDCLNQFSGDPPEVLKAQKKIGEEVVKGYRTVKILLQDHGRRQTSWLAPALGCVALRQYWEFLDPSNASKVASTSLVEAKTIVAGPPHPDLFTAPADYASRKPSDINIENIARAARKAGLSEADVQKHVEAQVARKKNEIFFFDEKYEKAERVER